MFYSTLENGSLIKRWFLSSIIFSLLLVVGWGVTTQLREKWRAQFTVEQNLSQLEQNSSNVLGAESQINDQELKTKLYNLISAYRNDSKLPKVTVHPRLEQSARAKLKDMIDHQYWQHDDQNDVEPWYFFHQVGYLYTTAGENLAFGASSAWQTFTDWQNSPAHNEQLLNPNYEHMGIAIDCQTFTEYYKAGCIVVLHLGSLK